MILPNQRATMWAYRNACRLHRRARRYRGTPKGPLRVRGKYRHPHQPAGAKGPWLKRPQTRRQRIEAALTLMRAIEALMPDRHHVHGLKVFAGHSLHLPDRQFGMVRRDTFDRAIAREYNRAGPTEETPYGS